MKLIVLWRATSFFQSRSQRSRPHKLNAIFAEVHNLQGPYVASVRHWKRKSLSCRPTLYSHLQLDNCDSRDTLLTTLKIVLKFCLSDLPVKVKLTTTPDVASTLVGLQLEIEYGHLWLKTKMEGMTRWQGLLTLTVFWTSVHYDSRKLLGGSDRKISGHHGNPR